jgi:lysophospholipase L1-like esterase
MAQGEGEAGAGRRRLARAALPLALAFAAAWVLQTLALRLGNTLHANGRWESTKVGLEQGILGAVSFLTTRTALHRDRLDLGTWHGFHELLLREPVAPGFLTLRFRLRDEGWLAAISAHDGERFEAVRLSRDPAFPSACLAGTAAGAFTAKQPLAAPAFDAGWHELALERDGFDLEVLLDGQAIGRCPAALTAPLRVGLRGSAASHVEVDDVAVGDAESGTTLYEDFANHRHAAALFAGALALLAALDAGVALALRRRGGALLPALALANGVALVCAGLALLADTAYFSRIHPEQVHFEGYENRIEYEGQIVPRLAREYPLEAPPAGVRRILVLGTSQTWGSGAARRADVWVRRLEAWLGETARPGERFELIDAGLPGETSKKVREALEKRFEAWRPELLLVNLGNNDRDPEPFARELERMARWSAERGVRVAFVPEPNCIESRSERSLRGLRAKHAAMREVAARHGIPVVEVHDALAAERDTGFLWWDRVHLTSYGQERLAQRLLEQRALWLDAKTQAKESR